MPDDSKSKITDFRWNMQEDGKTAAAEVRPDKLEDFFSSLRSEAGITECSIDFLNVNDTLRPGVICTVTGHKNILALSDLGVIGKPQQDKKTEQTPPSHAKDTGWER